jgi:hypothetical protein
MKNIALLLLLAIIVYQLMRYQLRWLFSGVYLILAAWPLVAYTSCFLFPCGEKSMIPMFMLGRLGLPWMLIFSMLTPSGIYGMSGPSIPYGQFALLILGIGLNFFLLYALGSTLDQWRIRRSSRNSAV